MTVGNRDLALAGKPVKMASTKPYDCFDWRAAKSSFHFMMTDILLCQGLFAVVH
jgi:hypothetical protein